MAELTLEDIEPLARAESERLQRECEEYFKAIQQAFKRELNERWLAGHMYWMHPNGVCDCDEKSKQEVADGSKL